MERMNDWMDSAMKRLRRKRAYCRPRLLHFPGRAAIGVFKPRATPWLGLCARGSNATVSRRVSRRRFIHVSTPELFSCSIKTDGGTVKTTQLSYRAEMFTSGSNAGTLRQDFTPSEQDLRKVSSIDRYGHTSIHLYPFLHNRPGQTSLYGILLIRRNALSNVNPDSTQL